MSQGNTLSSIAPDLKEYYTDEVVADATFQSNPVLALMPKNELVTGAHYNVPIIYGQGQGLSSNFSTALSIGNVSGTAWGKWQVSLQSQWGVATVSSEATLSSMNERGAFIKANEEIITGQLQNFGVELEFQLHRDGSGARGQISTSTTLGSSTLSFANPADALSFEIGMNIQFAANETTGGLRAQGSNNTDLIVGSVNYTAGSITVVNPAGSPVNITDATYGVPTAAAGDYIFRSGSRNSVMYGIQSWIPSSDPLSNDSFTASGINRSLNPVRLAGVRYNAQSMSTEEALIKAAGAVHQFGDDIDTYVMPVPKFSAFAASLGSKGQIIDLRATPAVGFRSIEILGQGMDTIKVVSSRACPSTQIFGLKRSVWELVSIRKAAFLYDLDTLRIKRQDTDSGLEARFMSYANLVCRKPSANVNITVQAAS